MGKKHIVTSALLYANGPIHIGHIAGAYLPADIYCLLYTSPSPRHVEESTMTSYA